MDIQDIRERQSKLNNYSCHQLPKVLNESIINEHALVTNLKNWKSLDYNERVAFKKALSLAENYIAKDIPECEKDRIRTIFTDEVIKSYANIKSIKPIIVKSNLGINVADKYSEFNRFVIADRVVNNQKVLDKKCNLSKYLKENVTSVSDNDVVRVCIENVCESINENFNADIYTKYNIALENTYYMLYNSWIRVPKETIVEAVNEYFYFQDVVPFTESVSKKILDENIIFEKVNLKKKVSKFKDTTFRDSLEALKKIPDKSPVTLKSLITKLYSKSPENIIEETPHILGFIRQVVCFSTAALNLWLGLVVFCVDQFIAMTIKRKEAIKMLDKYKAELSKAQKQLDNAKSEKSKERLKKYIDTLEESIHKLDDYEKSLYSERELDARYDEEDDFDFGEFDESTFMSVDEYMKNKHNSIMEHIEYVLNIMKNKINFINPKLLSEGIIELIDDVKLTELKEMSDEEVIDSLVGNNSCISIPLAYAMPNKYFNRERLENALDDICKLTTESVLYKTEAFNMSFDGNDDIYTIYIDYAVPVNRNIAECVQLDLLKKASYLEALQQQTERFIDNTTALSCLETKDIIAQGDVLSIHLLEAINSRCIPHCLNNFKEQVNDVIYNKLCRSESCNIDYIDTEYISESALDKMKIEKEKLYNAFYVKQQIKSAQSSTKPFKKLYNLAYFLLSVPVISVGGITLAAGIIIFVITAAVTAALAPKPSKVKLQRLKTLIERKLDEADAKIENGNNIEAMMTRRDELSESLDIINKELKRIEYQERQKTMKINSTRKEIMKTFKEDCDIVSEYAYLSYLSDSKRISKCVHEYTNIIDELNTLNDYNELMESFIEYENNKYFVLEKSSLKNNLKMSANRARNVLAKVNDKQKQASSRLDYAVEKFVSDSQKKMANNNREAVIKGSIIPSSSRLLKTCLATGIVATINPALAIVGLLGSIAISKRATAKERQYILDEIEIQLNIVDKKIQLAESNNDMKSLEQLLKIQKKLKREEQRIKYKMKNVYPVNTDD